MKTKTICSADSPEPAVSGAPAPRTGGSQSFDAVLDAAHAEQSGERFEIKPLSASPTEPLSRPVSGTATPSLKPAAGAEAAYREAMRKPAVEPGGWAKYKDDQLLRNPGGRHYFPEQKQVIENAPQEKSFFSRIGKDLSSVFGNMKNFVGNLFLGSSFLYRDRNNAIKEGHQSGMLGSVAGFFKNLAGALSFGAFHPGEKAAPAGFKNRLKYCASKLKDAFLGNALVGIPSAANHAGTNLVLAGLHLAEVMPDATVGNFDAGRKITTSIFDNGHVLVEYITDVAPFGDAWLRVHASNVRKLQAPVLYNLKMPEHYTGDSRWEYVRNTPFRKTIETLGALLADAAAIGLVGQTGFSGNRRLQPE
jgi:hypothetical protein